MLLVVGDLVGVFFQDTHQLVVCRRQRVRLVGFQDRFVADFVPVLGHRVKADNGTQAVSDDENPVVLGGVVQFPQQVDCSGTYSPPGVDIVRMIRKILGGIRCISE
ncbi:hypothetical protein D3C86_1552060 [compost metagenome]